MVLMKALISACLVFPLSADVVQAADLMAAPSSTPVELPEISPHWFVRVGVPSSFNQSSSIRSWRLRGTSSSPATAGGGSTTCNLTRWNPGYPLAFDYNSISFVHLLVSHRLVKLWPLLMQAKLR